MLHSLALHYKALNRRPISPLDLIRVEEGVPRLHARMAIARAMAPGLAGRMAARRASENTTMKNETNYYGHSGNEAEIGYVV